jgi:hypothetical protein
MSTNFGFMDAYQFTSGLLGPLFSARNQSRIARMQYNHSRVINRMDSQIRAQQMIRSVRASAERSAAGAAAILSVAHIDMAAGTANRLIAKSFEEADREVYRIMKTTLW